MYTLLQLTSKPSQRKNKTEKKETPQKKILRREGGLALLTNTQ